MVKKLPKLTRHVSGRCLLRVTDPNGKRRSFYLGPWPEGDKEPPLQAQIRRLEILESLESGKPLTPQMESNLPDDLTVTEFFAKFLDWAKTYHRPLHVDLLKKAFSFVLSKFPKKAAKDLNLNDLLSVQADLVRTNRTRNGVDLGIKRTRQGINLAIKRILEVIKAGASIGLIPGTTHANCRVIRPLKQGRTTAPESNPINPVTRQELETIMKALPSQILKDMADLQWYCGCRPGEIVTMTWGQIDTSGQVWKYIPIAHKTAHRGHKRVIGIGPHGQTILSRYFTKRFKPTSAIFSPRDALVEMNAAKRAKRASPIQPSQISRVKEDREIEAGEFYSAKSFTRALARAGDKSGITMSGNRIRKGRADQVATSKDLVSAAAMLGHRSATTTEIHYATTAAERRMVLLASELG